MIAGMSITPPPENARVKRPPRANERTTILAFLQWHRQTLALKCAGLTPEELTEPAIIVSVLSLLGLVRHAAESERFWFRRVMAGDDVGPLFTFPDAFDVLDADADMVAHAWEVWRAEVAFADRFIATAPDLDVTGIEPPPRPVSPP